jgi:hypothetical protein
MSSIKGIIEEGGCDGDCFYKINVDSSTQNKYYLQKQYSANFQKIYSQYFSCTRYGAVDQPPGTQI